MRKTIFFILIILVPFWSNAQNNSTDGNYVIYSKVGDKKISNPSAYRQLLKINPLLVVDGNVPLYYERKLGQKTSIELSAGVTFKYYVFDLFYTPPLLGYSDESLPIRKYQPGYSGSISIKFYPSNYTGALEGLYIAPEIRYRNYLSQAEIGTSATSSVFNGTSSTNPGAFLQESTAFTDFKFMMGYVTYLEDVVPVEFYWGIGFRERNITRAYNVSDSNGNNVTQLFTFTDSKPVISAGIKIGLGLK